MSDTVPRPDKPASKGSGARQTLKDRAADLASNAKEQLGNQYEQRVTGLMSEVTHLASALRRASQQLRDDDGAMIAATITDHLAMRLESLHGSVGNKDFNAVIGDVESFARRNPAAFLGICTGIGFMASRFLKSRTTGRGAL